MPQKVHYLSIYSGLYITLGFVFIVIFILGAVILQEFEMYLYIAAGLFLVVMGFSMRKTPYLLYDEQHIIVYGLFGQVRKEYSFEDKSEVYVRNKLFYLKDKKISANHWMVSKHDWRRAMEFFGEGSKLINELQDS